MVEARNRYTSLLRKDQWKILLETQRQWWKNANNITLDVLEIG
jgi:hypothetical protein